ncbi:hypothetical protein TrVE_jg9676 [Triparma verrucosa]|uniref:Uncharacterized protein n=2 Tax=Triparma TaxID=722752 RepID=A0A9W7DYU2_9STRA|nr:hypothetical protein TrST_g11598 [Triparma strigata]GMH91175.1 hypothetical protein TrVE_jg9676 [Triparma verrucosa]
MVGLGKLIMLMACVAHASAFVASKSAFMAKQTLSGSDAVASPLRFSPQAGTESESSSLAFAPTLEPSSAPVGPKKLMSVSPQAFSPPAPAPGAGLLSPNVVSRLHSGTFFDEETKLVVDEFLGQYEKEGPLSCLPFLSSPSLLNELTKAMGESIGV